MQYRFLSPLSRKMLDRLRLAFSLRGINPMSFNSLVVVVKRDDAAEAWKIMEWQKLEFKEVGSGSRR